MDSPHATECDPVEMLKTELASWKAKSSRPAFVTVLIHEDNFFRKGGTPWALVYYADDKKETPLRPPYDLNARDPSSPRPQNERDLILAAYERLVEYSVANLRVVTSKDLLQVAADNPQWVKP